MTSNRHRIRSLLPVSVVVMGAALASCVPPPAVPDGAGSTPTVTSTPSAAAPRDSSRTPPSTTTPSQAPSTTTSAPPTTAPGPTVPSPGVPGTSCGQTSCAPRGDLPGFRQTFVDDFGTAIPAGSFPAATNGRWGAYLDDWRDSSRRGRYMPSAISVSDGTLRLPVRTVNGEHRVAAAYPRVTGAPGPAGGQRYGRFAIRTRADPTPGYKFVALLWPDSERWPQDGEINFPEAELDGDVYGFMHRKDATVGSDQDWFRAGVDYDDWHTYVIEWTPTHIRFLLDGREIGRSTQRLPDTFMHWVLQAETSLDQSVVPVWAASEVQVDWVAVWEYTG